MTGAIPPQDEGRTRTEPVLVTARLVSGIEVTGYIHVKPDSYHTRVSDMLNRGTADFLPVTGATLQRPDGRTTSTDCIIVRREQIEVVVCVEASQSPPVPPPVEPTATAPAPVPVAPDHAQGTAPPPVAEPSPRVAW